MGLMDGLAGWLRQIIAVLLLASIVDLLLPNRTMQRYVRLVAGLFILLTVATPVLGWMKGDFGSRLAEGLSAVERSPRNAPEQLAMIEAEGEKLRDRQADQAADLVRTKLAAAIRADVEASEGREVRSVDVRTAKDESGSWTVTGVKVVLEGTGEPEAGSSPEPGEIAAVQGIAPIADVDIRVEVGGAAGASEPPDASGGTEAQEAFAPTAALDPDAESRIVSLVANKFGIAPRAIEVSQASAGTAGSDGASGSRR